MSSALRLPWGRLAAEFIVIVVGVLVALAVDQWVQARTDRTLEREYLERLLDDVRYDLGELGFLVELSQMSLNAHLQLADTPWARGAPADSVVAVALVASATRSPDLSRATFDELVNSGRIALLGDRKVREALSVYDRSVAENATFFALWRAGAQEWLLSRVPVTERESFAEACGTDPDRFERRLVRVCPHDFDFDTEALRRELLSDEARHRFTLLGQRHAVGISVLRDMMADAEALAAVLADALAGT